MDRSHSTTCSFEGCGRVVQAYGLCQTHRAQQKRGMPLTAIRPMKSWTRERQTPDGLCRFDGCGRRARSKGLCTGHWTQQSKGKLLSPLRRVARVRNGMKWCSSCEHELPVSAFASKGKYVQNWCRACNNIVIRSRTYGIPVNEVRDLLAGPCQVCGAKVAAIRHLHIDHCHESGRVRGVLCRNCNGALTEGMTPVVLRALADYLESSV
jgi:hypothetical protein